MKILKAEVIRDPSEKQTDCWRLVVDLGNGSVLCTPRFNSKGAASAYKDMVVKGLREPEVVS